MIHRLFSVVRLLGPLTLVWAMGGCVQAMSFDDLAEGMSTDDVQSRLGEPDFTETGDDLVAYQYDNIWITGWSDAPVAVVSYELGDGAVVFDGGQLAAASRGPAGHLMIEVQQGKERALFQDIHRWGEQAKYSGHFLNLGQRATNR